MMCEKVRLSGRNTCACLKQGPVWNGKLLIFVENTFLQRAVCLFNNMCRTDFTCGFAEVVKATELLVRARM